jgi:hypothetical protein
MAKTQLSKNEQLGISETFMNSKIYVDGMRFPDDFSRDDIEGFFSLQYWSMYYEFTLHDKPSYMKIKKNFIEKYGDFRVKKMEGLFLSSPNYSQLLRQHGVESSVLR